jgi:hypothetical protein
MCAILIFFTFPFCSISVKYPNEADYLEILVLFGSIWLSASHYM